MISTRSVEDLYNELKGNKTTKILVTWYPPIEPPSEKLLNRYLRKRIKDVQKAGYEIVGAITRIKRHLELMESHRTIISDSETLNTPSYQRLREYLFVRQTIAISATYDTERAWEKLKSRFKELHEEFDEDAINEDYGYSFFSILTL